MSPEDLLLPSQDQIRHVLRVEPMELEPFPATVLKLLRVIGDEKSSLNELSRIIETEPSMVVNLLRVVNSASYGLGRKIDDIKQAILQLGFLSVKGLAIEYSLFSYFKNGKDNINSLFFWRHCLAVAHLSKYIALALGHPSSDAVYTAGLLHDIGKIILDRYGKITYGDFVKARSGSPGLLIEEEADMIGMGHDDAGAYFCCKWDLPDSITLTVKFHHRPFAHLKLSHHEALLVACVSLADFLAWTQGIGSVDIPRQPLLQKEVHQLIDLRGIDLSSLVVKMDREVKNVADFYGVTFPTNQVLRGNLIKSNLHLSELITSYYDHQCKLKTDEASRAQISSYLAVPHQSLDYREIISSTLDAIQQGLGFDRVYFLEVSGPKRILTLSCNLCSGDSCNSLPSLQVRLAAGMKGFMGCMRTRQPAIITGESEGEQQILKTLSLKELGIVPVTSDKRVKGIIGVDNAQTGRALQLSDLTALVSVAKELGTALDHAKTLCTYRLKANTDHLTGLYNRAAVDGLLARAIALAKNNHSPLSVGMIDIDHFKKFNDTFGHVAGDGVLRLVAAALTKSSRPDDYTGRYGGEEFIVILSNIGHEDALLYAERIRSEIEKLGVTLIKRFKNTPLTVSIGVASITPFIRRKKELLKEADKALYQAKGLGRNRVVGSQIL